MSDIPTRDEEAAAIRKRRNTDALTEGSERFRDYYNDAVRTTYKSNDPRQAEADAIAAYPGVVALLERVQDETCQCFHPGRGNVVCGRCIALETWRTGK